MPGLTIKTIFSAIDRLTGPAKTMTRSVDKFGASASRSISGISNSVRRMRGLLISAAAILTTGVIARSITGFAEKGDEIGRTARTLGLTAEGLQELQYAAKQADLPAEELTAAFKKMNNNLGELKGGSGALYTHLKKANPQLARQLRTVKDSDGAFTLLMDAIAGTTDVQKRAALAQAAFGKSGQNLIEMASGGAAALARLREEAHTSGSMISNEGVAAADAFTKSLKKMTSSIQYLKNVALENLMQALTPVLENVAEWVRANRELLKQKIHDAVDKIVAAATKLYEIADKVVKTWNKLDKALGGKLAEDVLKIAVAWKAVTFAIGLAKAAQVAFNIASGGGAAGAAAGVAAGAGVGSVLAAAAVPAAVVLGTAALGQAYAKWQNSMITDPNQIAGGQKALMSDRQRVAYEALVAAKRSEPPPAEALWQPQWREGPPARVQIDFTNMPMGVVVRASPGGTGAPAVTLDLGGWKAMR